MYQETRSSTMNQETRSSNVPGTGADVMLPGGTNYAQIADLAYSSLESVGVRGMGTIAVGAAPSLASFAGVLDQLVQVKPELVTEVQRLAGRVARQYLVDRDLQVPSQDEFLGWLRTSSPSTRGGSVVRTFFWGFHVQLSHDDLQSFLVGAATVNTIVMAIGGGIPSPAQPWFLLIGGFIIGALAALKALDRGRGIYVSMSWFAPGLFVPTPV